MQLEDGAPSVAQEDGRSGGATAGVGVESARVAGVPGGAETGGPVLGTGSA